MKISKKLPKSKYLVIANWKNTPDTLAEAKKNFNLIKTKKVNTKKIIPIICPATVHLADLAKNYRGKIFEFGAQNVIVDEKNPHTGEVSGYQLKDLNIRYAIVGHAERRGLGETNAIVASKVAGCINSGITPILCVGELERDSHGEYLRSVEQQIVESLSLIKKNQLDKIVIAYEPVWSIGKGARAISSHEIHQMVIFVKKILVSKFDKKMAMEVPILYGGSVDPDNCKEILDDSEVRGLLIGRASSNPYSFVDILEKLK